jgi:hypothetical protein
MEKETLKNILDFIKTKDNRNIPFMWKLKNNEPITEDDLIVNGDLDLRPSNIDYIDYIDYMGIESLPEGLKVSGNLNLMGSDMQFLPKGLEVGGHLDLSYSLINSLPEGLKVGESLFLFDCANITSLPEGLKVGRNLDLSYTNITSLPRGLKVEGYIDMTGSKVTRYSDDELRKMVKPGYIKGRIIKV